MNNGCDVPGLMPIEQARKLIQLAIEPVSDIIESELKHALNKIIAADIISPIAVPAYDNSAMDGYALNYQDYVASSKLTQVGKSFAGSAFEGKLAKGECVRIMTGAQIPSGADTVVMQENANAQGNIIEILKANKGDAIRLAGSDIAKGAKVFSKGHRISPIDIGLLASLGIDKVPVFRQIKVAVFSTGDELLAVGQAPQSNRIYDTNRPMLVAMLSKIGAQVIDLGIIPDDKSLIQKTFTQANELADCVITSGGVSVGEADYTREVLAEYGDIHFWKLAIKPGKPLAFGKLPNSLFFGLPGNPVSSAVTFEQIALPALAVLASQTNQASTLPKTLRAKATSVFKKRPGRADFQRATYYVDDDGQLCVETSITQSSGVLSCYQHSNCYAVLEQDRGPVGIGEQVQVLPFSSVI